MGNDYLAHYGVKGMKWGVRKDRGPKTGQRRSPNAQGGLRIAGNAARAVGRGVVAGGRVVGRGIAAGGRAIGSVPSRVQAANFKKRKAEAIEAIKRGDSETVKKNLKYLTADEIHATLDRVNAEKRLMSEIDRNRERRGAEKVADALNGIGNSRVANAVKKGATEGLQDVTKTIVKGVATDSGDTASKAVGAGIGSAFTAWALYKTVGGDTPDYRQAFKTGATESLRRAARDKYSLDLSSKIHEAKSRDDAEKVRSSFSGGGNAEVTPSRGTNRSSSKPIDISTGKAASKDPYAKAQAAADATRSPASPPDISVSSSAKIDRAASKPIDITTGRPAQTKDPYQSAQEKAVSTPSKTGEKSIYNSSAFRNGYQQGHSSMSVKGEEEVDKALDKRLGRIRIQ